MTAKVPEVSWKAIERDAEVVSAEGESIGRVMSVVGDPDADIFTGLAVAVDRLGGIRLVASERVVNIWPGRVEVDLADAEIDRLPEYEETPTVRWRPGISLMWLIRRLLRR